MLKNREGHHSDGAVKRGYELRCEKIALCITAFRGAALWCTKELGCGGRCAGLGVWAKYSKARDWRDCDFAIRIANHKSLAIWRGPRCDSAVIWKWAQITNRAIWKCDLSFFFAICGKFLRFGLCDLKSLAVCNLRFGALRVGELGRRVGWGFAGYPILLRRRPLNSIRVSYGLVPVQRCFH